MFDIRNLRAVWRGLRCGSNRLATACLVAAVALWISVPALAQTPRPEELIETLSAQVIRDIKEDSAIQSGDVAKVLSLVESTVMPHVDARRMTASAMGRYWRQASPEQRMRLEDEFMRLVVRTYAGALTQVRDQTIRVKPPRRAVGDALQVVVKTEVRGGREPIQLDYRLIKTPAGWKIYDVNVLGVWLIQNYRGSFARSIGASGIDGLIEELTTKNQSSGNR